jgi:sialic acid synthase
MNLLSIPIVVAEAGCNHCGKIDIAEELIKMAALFCKADYIKFQKRSPRELLSTESYNSPQPNPFHSYGETYGAHREYLEFTIDQHRQLWEWCLQYGIKYSCSTWDITSAREIMTLDIDYIKIPSASNTHYDMIRLICDEFGGQIHVSLGMTTRQERDILIELIQQKGRLTDTVLYKCTSGYPVPFGDCHLAEITELVKELGSEVAAIGFSGHHLGIAIDNAAYALGARWFERHYTLDRTLKGTDHAASLEPDGMRRLSRDLRATATAMAPKPAEILEIEKPQREKLKWTQK